MIKPTIKFWICVYALFSALSLSSAEVIASDHPRYEITAKLDSVSHKITASSKVTFTNNSASPIDELHFHIYPHRKYSLKDIRFLYQYSGYFKVNPFPEGFQSGDLKIGSVFSGSQKLSYEIQGQDQTILNIKLGSVLKPGETREIQIDFITEIPHSYGRFGWHNGVVTLLRWYPILSVLDKDGWHDYPFYIYHQPFFSEASYYNVKITLDSDQQVASSGIVKEEVLNNDGTKTLVLDSEYPIRDFSLGVSDKFLKHSIDDGKVRINSYYLKGDESQARAAALNAASLIKYYSNRFGEYPFREFDIVPSYLGFGGDQSSGLIFIDTRVYKLPDFLKRYFDFLISHETGHQWFYNIIGTDEYKEMFLDEGMNSYWVIQYLEDKYGPDALVMTLPRALRYFIPNFSFRSTAAGRYLYMAKNGMDQPILGELSSFREPSAIFAMTYGKGAAVLDMLKSYLGQEVFDKIMRRYTREYKFLNFKLDDFLRICNEESGQDLNWFFQQWLRSKDTCDYLIMKPGKNEILLKRRGEVRMPVKTRIKFVDGREVIDSWDGQGLAHSINIPANNTVKSAEADYENTIVLDMDRTNNYWPRGFNLKPVPLYFFAYEIPMLMPRETYNAVIGPAVGGSSLGVASSLQKPYDQTLRLKSNYDFGGKAWDSSLGYEISHLCNQQAAAGFEIFDYESSKEKNDVSGGKIYLRKELWPASYGLFDANDHATIYIIRDQKIDQTSGLNGQEDARNSRYLKKDEAIVGLTGSLGRYGPYSDPNYGWRFIPTQEFAGHFLGGNDAFWRTSVELDKYHLIFPKYQNKIANRIKFGWGEASDKNLFQLGGTEGLRGYSLKTVQGSHMFLESFEYRLPVLQRLEAYFFKNMLCLDQVQAVGFLDIGKAWYADFSGSDFKKDAGLGLRFHFTILGFLEKAVVRIDLAQAINEPKEDPHLWFGINQNF